MKLDAKFFPMSITLMIILSSCTTTNLTDSDCSLEQTKRQQILALGFKDFDQSKETGWRPLYERKCYKEAATLIEDYIHQNKTEHYILPFHAANMYAMNNDYTKAKSWFKKSYHDKRSNIVNWNAFVDANIAFLDKDKEKLLISRKKILKQPTLTADMKGLPEDMIGKKMNLDVVDGFIACFNKSYVEAYHSCSP